MGSYTKPSLSSQRPTLSAISSGYWASETANKTTIRNLSPWSSKGHRVRSRSQHLIQLCGQEERSNVQGQREGTCSSRSADEDHHEKLYSLTVNSVIQWKIYERISTRLKKNKKLLDFRTKDKKKRVKMSQVHNDWGIWFISRYQSIIDWGFFDLDLSYI